jgi:hypothetical protein
MKEKMAVTFTAITQQPIIAKAAKVVYEPSVYNGTGLEVRRNLVLAVDDSVRDQLATIETQLNLGPTLCSVLKPEGVRVKIDMEQVRLFDADHHQINAPERWANACVEVRLEVRGTWKTASNCGLSVSCTDLRFCSDNSVSPFK